MGLTEIDLEKIKTQVSKAEKTTTGEISIAITKESSDYSFYELLFSVFIGLLAFIEMLPFCNDISDKFSRLFWVEHSWYVTAFIGFVSFVVIAISFFIANIPCVDRLVVPRQVRTECVRQRAMRQFIESGVSQTIDHSGILIFISLLEREVRIIADTGIATKIAQEQWDRIADDIAFGFRSSLGAAALESAVDRCGALLSENFPAKTVNPNELSDEVTILEDK